MANTMIVIITIMDVPSGCLGPLHTRVAVSMLYFRPKSDATMTATLSQK